MREILERLESICKGIDSSDNVLSIYGTRFVNDFKLVVTRIDEGTSYERDKDCWLFTEISFADQRRNNFVFRPKFLRKMNENDKRLARLITSKVMSLALSNNLCPYEYESQEEKLIQVVSVCRDIHETVTSGV